MKIELFLNSSYENHKLNGKLNSEARELNGIFLVCKPQEELIDNINLVLQDENNFPFEYYDIDFRTFSGEKYFKNRKYLNHIKLDQTQINSEYANKIYVKELYRASATPNDINDPRNKYRKIKTKFNKEVLSKLTTENEEYQFQLKEDVKNNLDANLTIARSDISIDDLGKGVQCFIRVKAALKRSKEEINTLLIEEPENHLSHTYMHRMINTIQEEHAAQTFITTHNSMISSRLDLRNVILLNRNSYDKASLKDLSKDTAKFFMKNTTNNILELSLSEKVILVEGAAEYILMEKFYNDISNGKTANTDIHIIAVNGVGFKRYIEIAKLLNIKTAIIKDNDGDHKKNCIDLYKDYTNKYIRIFYDIDDDKIKTFEDAIYNENANLCKSLFKKADNTLEFMKKSQNKAECAFRLLDSDENITIPEYIKEAIKWINN